MFGDQVSGSRMDWHNSCLGECVRYEEPCTTRQGGQPRVKTASKLPQ